jgi:organic hydroperoxide reductase OsmC/OhrA
MSVRAAHARWEGDLRQGKGSMRLAEAGHVPTRIEDIAQRAKAGCPVSRALAAVDISLRARLAGP